MIGDSVDCCFGDVCGDVFCNVVFVVCVVGGVVGVDGVLVVLCCGVVCDIGDGGCCFLYCILW